MSDTFSEVRKRYIAGVVSVICTAKVKKIKDNEVLITDASVRIPCEQELLDSEWLYIEDKAILIKNALTSFFAKIKREAKREAEIV